MKPLKDALEFEALFNYRVFFNTLAGLILFSSLKGDEKASELSLMQMSQASTELKTAKLKSVHNHILSS